MNEMEALLDRIQRLAQHESISRLPQMGIDRDYLILEESDMFGFCHANVSCDPAGANLVQVFRNDENWNNPECIPLMQLAYDLDDSFISLHHSTDVAGALHYQDVRRQQQMMFSKRLMVEGAALLDRLKVTEAIHKLGESLKFHENAKALHLRAHAFLLLKEPGNARNDILAAMKVDPLLVPEYDGARSMYMEEMAHAAAPPPSLLGKRPASTTNADGSDRHSGLIEKLQRSLAEDTGSSSDSESSSAERSRRRKSKKKHKHKHKLHKESKDKKKKRKHSSSS